MESQTASLKAKSFSSVGSTEAYRFLDVLGVLEISGNAIFPEELQIPEGTCTCSSFDLSQYYNEGVATEPLLQHHKQQLERLNVKFGRGGFDVYNVHSLTKDALLIQHGKLAFRGIFDGGIAPFGLSLNSALRRCRIVYEHKMPQVG
jgi:hypothetical protein